MAVTDALLIVAGLIGLWMFTRWAVGQSERRPIGLLGLAVMILAIVEWVR